MLGYESTGTQLGYQSVVHRRTVAIIEWVRLLSDAIFLRPIVGSLPDHYIADNAILAIYRYF